KMFAKFPRFGDDTLVQPLLLPCAIRVKVSTSLCISPTAQTSVGEAGATARRGLPSRPLNGIPYTPQPGGQTGVVVGVGVSTPLLLGAVNSWTRGKDIRCAEVPCAVKVLINKTTAMARVGRKATSPLNIPLRDGIKQLLYC